MLDFIVLSTPASNDASIAIAASRAGALGVVNIELATDPRPAWASMQRVAEHSRGRWGVLLDDPDLLGEVLAADLPRLDTVLISAAAGERSLALINAAHSRGLSALAVITSAAAADEAAAHGADGVIAKGHEAGGWVGEEGAFVLLQRVLDAVEIPVWVHGGIGPHTIAAAAVAGVAGVVLDAQVVLARESGLPDAAKSAIAAMDGSETAVLGTELGCPFRLYSRPGVPAAEALRSEAEALIRADAPDCSATWQETVKAHAERGVLPIGQDGTLAAGLAERFGTVAGIVEGLGAAARDAEQALGHGNPMAAGGALARSHGTRYPIVQGPMTRVSDRAEFAAAVAQAGALPFLALALMRAGEVDALLAQTRDLLGDRPWGVGLLGFVPQVLRAEQLEVVRAHRPPFALIAGGRPDQARELEAEGITTYLHVPSPGLLRLYLAQGARRFVFEGRECGGHVGPRSSFVLWESALSVIESDLARGESAHLLFAGGVHDGRSAAMVAAAAARAAARGVNIGTLVGTAYLFTREATEQGAITETFQRAAIATEETVLLESGPGHATRCAPSPFVEQFEAEKRRLRGADTPADELRGRLEELNIGRLRIAAKGCDRNPRFGPDPDAPKLIELDQSQQWEQGMFMIGQVAALHHEVTTLAELHADIAEGSGDVLVQAASPVVSVSHEPPPPAEVAVVGVATILPDAPDAETFWANILAKHDAIREIPTERWEWERMYDPEASAPDKVNSRWGGFIDPVAFDPMALGMPPRSLYSVEPFQLLALLTAQAALTDAGYATRPFDRERTSVILGAGGGGADLSVGYTVRSALPQLLRGEHDALQAELYERLPEWTEDSFAGLLMNVAAGRVANRLDFGGTNFTVDAACASSLAAIALAVRELRTGTSEMVLAGGVDAIQNPFAYLCFAKTRALSPRGRCRPFDATADGIAISEGFATVVLKRLADAERDGDRIYAVIRGVGAASDGRDRSLTAPRPEGQVRALRRAYAQARFSPATVGLIEAHGTGTVAGDGAEVQALSTVFAEHGSARQSTAIGSVKSMIGHTKATAGVAGLIKASLALHHRVLPPTIGVQEPNPKANFPDSPFYVNSQPRPWLAGGTAAPRRAGVSAFGFGGTDFHIALEEYTGDYLGRREATVTRWPMELMLWRGTREEISSLLTTIATQLDVGAAPPLSALAKATADAAGAADGRPTLAIVAESLADLGTKLAKAQELLAAGRERFHLPLGLHFSAQPLARSGRVAFLFPGQGSQTVDMARDLALAFSEARAPFEHADRALAERYPQPLSRYIFPPPAFTDEHRRHQQEELTDTHVAQAALGASELACLRVLEACGVRAEMAGGHSYGEFVALAVAGAITEDRLLHLSEARGRFMAEAAAGEAGAMAAVDAAPEALGPLFDGGELVAANLNAPQQTVISGAGERVDAALRWCDEHGIRARRLPVACAFHSPHVAGAQRQLAEVLQEAELSQPTIPVYSNTTGDAHADDPASIRAVLADHLTRPVEFVSEVQAMHRDGARIFVEVGPRSVLTGLVEQILGEGERLAVAIDRRGRPGLAQLVYCLAALAAEGVPVRSERLFAGRRTDRIDLRRLTAGRAPAPRDQWLVDGGRVRAPGEPSPARGAGVPAMRSPNGRSTSPPSPTQPQPTIQEQPPVTATKTNGTGALAPAATTGPAGPAGAAGPPLSRPAPAAGDRVGDVMSRYQQVMQQFLETQRAVMLSYLGGGRPVGGMAPYAQPGVVSAPGPMAALPAPPPMTPAPAAPAPAPATPAPPTLAAPAPAPPIPAPPPVAAVAAPQPAAPPPTTNGAHVELSRAEIEQRLLAVVSERTGYPADMLELDADLEGDLGIDSIKRVEIAGTFTQDLDPEARTLIDVEQLTASRTLRTVIDVLQASLSGGGSSAPAVGGEARPFRDGPADTERIGRFVVDTASAPAITTTAPLAATGATVIVDPDTPLGDALATALGDRDEPVLRLPLSSAPQDQEEAAAIAAALRSEYGGVKALVVLGDPAADHAILEPLFLVTQALRGDLEAAAAAGGAVVLAVTWLGGRFGIGGAQDGQPGQAAVAGYLKSLAYEWPAAVRVKVVDLPAAAGAQAAGALLSELAAADGLMEVGYDDGRRVQVRLAPASLEDRPDADAVTSESVVLVTGGARGITAQAALALAERARPTLVLVGRTPLTDESPETTALADLPALRAGLIAARRRDGGELKPALIEAEVRRVLAGRELRENLERLRATGSIVDYVPCDVGDADAFQNVIADVYDRYGRIDGVIHGAGVIEDKLIRDKALASLRRVVATKAGAAHTLARALRADTLRFLAFFSSVSGRFGNRGQADYAAASEGVSRLAHDLDSRWPGRVVSIDWGPWRTTGMVSAALEEEFARRGVVLIPPPVGCRMLVEELLRGRKGEAEVVIGAATGLSAGAVGATAGDAPAPPAEAVGATAGDAPAPPALPMMRTGTELARLPDGGLRAIRRLTVTRDRYLDDHRVDGVPVLPFAAAMEAMAEAAAAATPGAVVAGLRAIRLLKGISVPDGEQTAIQIDAAPDPAGGPTVASIGALGSPRPHYRAFVELGSPAAPIAEAEALAGLPAFPIPIADAYRELLFHGPLFQGILEMTGLDERGASGVLRGSNAGDCVAGADGLRWLLDPVLLDSALQVQVMWARLTWGVTLLPAEIAGYTRHSDLAEGERVRHELRIQPRSTPPLCHADHWFFGADGRLIATLGDVVGVGSQALNRLAGAQA